MLKKKIRSKGGGLPTQRDISNFFAVTPLHFKWFVRHASQAKWTWPNSVVCPRSHRRWPNFLSNLSWPEMPTLQMNWPNNWFGRNFSICPMSHQSWPGTNIRPPCPRSHLRTNHLKWYSSTVIDVWRNFFFKKLVNCPPPLSMAPEKTRKVRNKVTPYTRKSSYLFAASIILSPMSHSCRGHTHSHAYVTFSVLHKCHNAWVQGRFSGYALRASQLYYITSRTRWIVWKSGNQFVTEQPFKLVSLWGIAQKLDGQKPVEICRLPLESEKNLKATEDQDSGGQVCVKWE
jgi:hypothetical protein